MRARGVFGSMVAAVMAVTALAGAAPSQAGMAFTPAYSVPGGVNPVDTPIYVTAPPGDSSRLFIVERAGRIRVAVDGVLQDAPFLDIHTLVDGNGEGGLLSIAFAPDYATSRKFYVYFVEPPDVGSQNGDIRIEEYQRSAGDQNAADFSTRRLILEIAHDDFNNHYGGQLQFGPGGKLYAGTGDGGGGGNPLHHAQDSGSNLGKLLAIDPATPPVITQAAIGLRNPFRFSFDRANGDLVLGDVGQDKWEEIDWVPAPTLSGLNFGWSCYEGNEARDALNTCPGALTFPVQTYQNLSGPSSPAAVTGGVVVRDPGLTTLVGRYIYADFFAGRVRSLELASPNAADDRQEDQLPKVPQLVAFGEDASAHVYVVSLAGPVYRITCDTTCDPPASGGGGGGGNPPPDLGQLPAPPTTPNPDVPPAVPAAADRTAPQLILRGRRVQRVAPLGRLRLSALCSEDCSVRVTARATNALRRSLAARRRSTIELSTRLRRATRVTITVRATDSAGNGTIARLVVRLKR